MSAHPLDLKIKFMRGFADKTRLHILECLRQGEKTVSQIIEETNGNQSNISQHLACLKDCGLIVGRQEGKFVYYSLRNVQVRELLDMIDHVLSHVKDEIMSCTRYGS